MSLAPHGGHLVDRILTGAALEAAKANAATLPRVKVDAYAAFDIDCIAKGIFSPLTGFMNEAEVRSVLDKMHLRPGIPWTIPILLSVPSAEAAKLAEGTEVAIEDDEGDIVAILHLASKFTVDHREIAEKTYARLTRRIRAWLTRWDWAMCFSPATWTC